MANTKSLLVDQYGRTLSSVNTLYKTPKTSAYGSFIPRYYKSVDTHNSIDQMDRQELVDRSRDVFANFAAIGNCIISKNKLSYIGGYVPRYTGADEKWGEIVENWLINTKLPNCNVMGSNYDWETSLYTDGCSIDINGESLMAFIRNKYTSGKIKFIQSHRIGSRTEMLDAKTKQLLVGSYRGYVELDGVVLSKQNTPLAYHYLADAKEDDYWIASKDCQMAYEPDWIDAYRGIPVISRCLSDVMHLQDVDQFIIRMLKRATQLPVLMHNELGTAEEMDIEIIKSSDYGSVVDENSNSTTTVNKKYSVIDSGDLQFIRADIGGKIEIPRVENPTPNVLDYIKKKLGDCIAAIGWNQAFESPEFNGSGNRSIVEQIRNTIKCRQKIGLRRAKAAINFFIATGMEMGEIPNNANGDWMSWSFSLPKPPSIDSYNDRKANIDDIKFGITSKNQVVAANGGNIYSVIDEKYTEECYIQDKAIEYYNKYKASDPTLTVDKARDYINSRYPNPPATIANPSPITTPTTTKEDEEVVVDNNNNN